MATPKWFVTASGREQGPFTSEQLKEFVTTGKLKPDMPIRKEGMDEPVMASKVQGLFGPPTSRTAKPPTSQVQRPTGQVRQAPPVAAPPPQAESADEDHYDEDPMEEMPAEEADEAPAEEPKRETRSRRRGDAGGNETGRRTRGTRAGGRGGGKSGTARHGKGGGKGRSSRRVRADGDDEEMDGEDDPRRRGKKKGSKGLMIGLLVLLLLGAGGFFGWYFIMNKKADIKGTWELDLTATTEELINQVTDETQKTKMKEDLDKMKQGMAGQKDFSLMQFVVDGKQVHLSLMGMVAPPLDYVVDSATKNSVTVKVTTPAKGEGAKVKTHQLTMLVEGDKAKFQMPVPEGQAPPIPALADVKNLKLILVFIRKSADTTPPKQQEGGLFGPMMGPGPMDDGAITPPPTDGTTTPADTPPPGTTVPDTGRGPDEETPSDTTETPPTTAVIPPAPAEPPTMTVNTDPAAPPAECWETALGMYDELAGAIGSFVSDCRSKKNDGSLDGAQVTRMANGLLARFLRYERDLNNAGFKAEPTLKQLQETMLKLIGTYREYLAPGIAEVALQGNLATDERLSGLTNAASELNTQIEQLLDAHQ